MIFKGTWGNVAHTSSRHWVCDKTDSAGPSIGTHPHHNLTCATRAGLPGLPAYHTSHYILTYRREIEIYRYKEREREIRRERKRDREREHSSFSTRKSQVFSQPWPMFEQLQLMFSNSVIQYSFPRSTVVGGMGNHCLYLFHIMLNIYYMLAHYTSSAFIYVSVPVI